MTKIEQLRADIAAIETARKVAQSIGWSCTADTCDQLRQEVEKKIAALEAEEAKKEKADRWREAKSIFDEWEQSFKGFRCTPARATEYVRHLEAEVQRLSDESEVAKCEKMIEAQLAQIERLQADLCKCGGIIVERLAEAANLRSKNERLEAELAKRPVVWCAIENGKLLKGADGHPRLYLSENAGKNMWYSGLVAIEPYTGEQQ